jgi:predicted ester cyclase
MFTKLNDPKLRHNPLAFRSELTTFIAESCNGSGPEGARREFEAFFKAFPDLEVTLEDILTTEVKVATRVTMRGTHGSHFMGIPATGKSVVMKANHLCTLESG